MHSDKKVHLNWLKLDILGLLWNRKMYGLDIQQALNLIGETTSPGQLYPALQKLEDLGAVECEEKEQKGSNPKYYTITDRGKQIFLHNMLPIIFVMDSIAQEKFKDIPQRVKELGNFKQGDIIVDFSNWRQLSMYIAPIVAPTGRVFITAKNERHKKMLEDYLEFEKVDDYISVVISTRSSIPPQSVDLVIAAFILHEDGTDWIIKEIKRLLKPKGCAILIDQTSLNGHFLEQFFASIVPNHSKVGIVIRDISLKLEKNGLKITSQEETKEKLVYLVVEHA
ncbi:MAG: helix-turn-helix transcriptional regulator [Candidatus Hodarchaeota archaeon]